MLHILNILYIIVIILLTIINKDGSIVLKTHMSLAAGLTGFESMENSRGTNTSP